jgi:hypothetical protein
MLKASPELQVCSDSARQHRFSRRHRPVELVETPRLLIHILETTRWLVEPVETTCGSRVAL